jgi:hypothetical protein
MKPEFSSDDPNRDPLAAYADGDPDAVRAARPREPDEAQWEPIRRRVRTRLAGALRQSTRPAPPHSGWRRLAAAVVLAVAAAALACAIVLPLSAPQPNPPAPDATTAARAGAPVAPVPHDGAPDPLAEFAVLPLAGDDQVVFLRVPGEGWFPVGTPPLAGSLDLAGADDVELEQPDPAWPQMTPAPGSAPMIFAAKPR